MRVLGSIALVALLAGCDGLPGGQTEEEVAIKEAEMTVAYSLSDPESAQFLGVTVSNDAVCGQVNAKNKLGGYVGFRNFIVHDGTALLEPSEAEPPSGVNGDQVLQDAHRMIAEMRAKTAFLTKYNELCFREAP